MLLVTTPTGQIGEKVLRHLLNAGEATRVVVRSAATLPSDVRDRVEVVTGSHADPDVLDRACPGVRGVLHVVPPAPSTPDVEQHYRAFASATASAVTRHGVQQVVTVSTLGDRYDRPAGQLTAALTADSLLAASGVGLRVLALPFFMENLLHQVPAIHHSGRFALANTGTQHLPMVATADVATVASGLLLDPAWRGQERIRLVSPDSLTLVQAAQVLTGVLGKPITFQQASIEEYRTSLVGYGSSPAWAAGLARMVEAQNDGIYDESQSSGTRTVGTTDLATWVADTLRPALAAAG